MRVNDTFMLTGGDGFIIVMSIVTDGKTTRKGMGCRGDHIFFSRLMIILLQASSDLAFFP